MPSKTVKIRGRNHDMSGFLISPFLLDRVGNKLDSSMSMKPKKGI